MQTDASIDFGDDHRVWKELLETPPSDSVSAEKAHQLSRWQVVLNADREYLIQLASAGTWPSTAVDQLRDVCSKWKQWGEGSYTTAWTTHHVMFVDQVKSSDSESS